MRVGKEAIVVVGWEGGVCKLSAMGWIGEVERWFWCLFEVHMRRSTCCLPTYPPTYPPEVIQPSEPVFPRPAIVTSCELNRMTGSAESVLG